MPRHLVFCLLKIRWRGYDYLSSGSFDTVSAYNSPRRYLHVSGRVILFCALRDNPESVEFRPRAIADFYPTEGYVSAPKSDSDQTREHDFWRDYDAILVLLRFETRLELLERGGQGSLAFREEISSLC